jgi:hypothetical protein
MTILKACAVALVSICLLSACNGTYNLKSGEHQETKKY